MHHALELPSHPLIQENHGGFANAVKGKARTMLPVLALPFELARTCRGQTIGQMFFLLRLQAKSTRRLDWHICILPAF